MTEYFVPPVVDADPDANATDLLVARVAASADVAPTAAQRLRLNLGVGCSSRSVDAGPGAGEWGIRFTRAQDDRCPHSPFGEARGRG